MKALYTVVLLMTASFLLSACASAPPATTDDGLVLVEESRFDSLYLKPGVDLSAYTHVHLEPCTVTFKDNWLRNQNRGQGVASRRVAPEDMVAIKERIGEACDRHFTEALQDHPHYSLIQEETAGEKILTLSPAIIDVDIRAPDTRATGIQRTYTTSFGEMSLRLEMTDALSGDILGRINDRQRDLDDVQLRWTNRATNMADVNRFLRAWRDYLLEGLDIAYKRSPIQ